MLKRALIDKKSKIYVAERKTGKLLVFNIEGEYQTSFPTIKKTDFDFTDSDKTFKTLLNKEVFHKNPSNSYDVKNEVEDYKSKRNALHNELNNQHKKYYDKHYVARNNYENELKSTVEYKELEKIKNLYVNPSISIVLEHIIKNNEGVIGLNGAAMVDTGVFTGRSPKDKYFVEEDTSKDNL